MSRLSEPREINTKVARCDTDVNKALEGFLSKINNEGGGVIGLSTEYSFVRNSLGKNETKLAILNLCQGKECLIVQLLHLNKIPTSLLNFLHLPNLTFVGIRIKEDVAKLEKEYGLVCKNAVGLESLAAQVFESPAFNACGLDEILRKLCLGQPKISGPSLRSVHLDDWGKASLTGDQVMAAANSPHLCWFIGIQLLKRARVLQY